METSQQRLVVQVARFFPEGVFYKRTAEKVIALTIDDLPTPNEIDDASSRMILDAIATHNQSIKNSSDHVHATFFIISGHLSNRDTLLNDIVGQGHEIGNHGTADETAAMLESESFNTQFKAAHRRITQQITATPHPPLRWYRPGRGLYKKAMLSTLQQMPDYVPRFALASMLPVDTFKPTHDAAFTAWYVSQHFFPGSILVLHGGSLERCQQTAKALPSILSELHQQGYKVVTLSELWDKERWTQER
ncbi:Peptidoglycan-N-acetylglucosamine deacetylase [Acaryochloris thomasi RCC1774]|uniref:Peptidoglycan-N-acetylglucosamine deacetylase n=1 Tax=Acaryochloris thomasi RCC1774 TaxID=1764569 RepID=A0A2W1J913_9CYAN|nr:polysaccharide deacetylase family protein [Acaryochloris thomasi]PZD70813.1 Peptidoglycan-N-acetylglucosamine deacetylase [Acaryochloris thomasi RCC1774]